MLLDMSIPPFSVTTTAMARPDILRRTYESFSKNLLDVNFKEKTLYINVDPLPLTCGGPGPQKECIEVAKDFFGNVVYNCPSQANFAVALKWVWAQSKTDWIFHLEDDWEFIGNFSISELFNRRGACHQVVFRAYNQHVYNMVLSPSIIRRDFYSSMAKKLPNDRNPEKTMRTMPGWSKNTVTAYPKNRHLICVKDIGREWAAKNGILRGAGPSFIHWLNK